MLFRNLNLKNYTVKRYEPKYFEEWNAFISTAKNATFLFNRDFMEYHSDRFEDFSLLIFDQDKLVSEKVFIDIDVIFKVVQSYLKKEMPIMFYETGHEGILKIYKNSPEKIRVK